MTTEECAFWLFPRSPDDFGLAFGRGQNSDWTPQACSAFPARQVSHGMFQSPSPSVPGSVGPTVLMTSTTSPRLLLFWNDLAYATVTFIRPLLTLVKPCYPTDHGSP